MLHRQFKYVGGSKPVTLTVFDFPVTLWDILFSSWVAGVDQFFYTASGRPVTLVFLP